MRATDSTVIIVSSEPRPRVHADPNGLSDVELIAVTTWARLELARRRVIDLALTRREHQVLERLVDGSSYKQIAFDLAVSLSTVQTHVRSLYRKLGVHSATEAVSRALRDHLVVPEAPLPVPPADVAAKCRWAV